MLEVLISTIGNGIFKTPQILLSPQKNVKYLVVHQIENSNKYSYPDTLYRDDVKILPVKGKGLTKSRNIALKNATGEICIIADDDVSYKPSYFQSIISIYRKYDIDIGLFMINTEEEREYKKYPKDIKLIKISDRHSVSSVEITFKRKSILSSKVLFDERFGLGSWLNGGGEQFFVYDALKSGLSVIFFPYYIVNHRYDSTIKTFPPFHVRRVRQIGAVDARLNGYLAILKIPYSLIKEYGNLKNNNKSILEYAKERFQGAIYILTNPVSSS